MQTRLTGLLNQAQGSVRCLARRARARFAHRNTDASDLSRPIEAGEWAGLYPGKMELVAAVHSPLARLLAKWSNPGDVALETGCGTARISAELAILGRKVELGDFSQPILDRARRLFEMSGLPAPRTTVCDLTRPPLPWPDRAVDICWSSGVLEHWTDEELGPIVSELRRISRQRVVAFVPYAGCVLYRMAKHLAESKGRWPYGRELPRMSLRAVFEDAGLRDVEETVLCVENAAGLISLTDPALSRVINAWWNSLPDDDPVRKGQGYLLATMGHVP